MKIIITEKQSKKLKRIVNENFKEISWVIAENEKLELLDSLERRLNRSIDTWHNRDKLFSNSPKALVFQSQYNPSLIEIRIMYDNFMSESDGIGIILKDILQDTMEDIGEENGIKFEYKSSNLGDYDRRHSSRDFGEDNYELRFTYQKVTDEFISPDYKSDNTWQMFTTLNM